MVENALWSGCLALMRTSTNVDCARAFFSQDWCLTIRMITDEININECTVHQNVIQDLNVKNYGLMILRNCVVLKCWKKCSYGLKLSQIILLGSQEVMKILLFFNMALKPRRAINDTCHSLQDRRMLTREHTKSR
jgi:hypothetical protein